jgi:hypothetical protein
MRRRAAAKSAAGPVGSMRAPAVLAQLAPVAAASTRPQRPPLASQNAGGCHKLPWHSRASLWELKQPSEWPPLAGIIRIHPGNSPGMSVD